MPSLGLGTELVIDPPVAPTFKTAPPAVPNLLISPGPEGPPGPAGESVLPSVIDLGGPNNSNGA